MVYNKFEKEVALCTFLIRHNVNVTARLWRDLIIKEGPKSLSPYLKGLLTRMTRHADALEAPCRKLEICKEECVKMVPKITDYYAESRGEFMYLMKRGYSEAHNTTLPDKLFGDSFLSLMIANHYLKRKLEKTVERMGSMDSYNRLQCALDQWVKFYRNEIIYSEDDIKEILQK